ncbi:MAG: flagellar hook-associated protein FlgK [Acidobacteriota bacterium]|nr:flagellar hook-associated protein FlgK [Acidobacteriota bacterium]
MSSLFGTMSVALRSLLAQQGAMGVTANNIANANTPGYSREVAILEESPPTLMGNTMVGTGVTMEKVESVRDNILNLRIDQETSQQSSLGSYLTSMDQVQALFNETQGAGLQTDLSAFFNSFQSLSTDPTSSSLRQATITAGQNLAGAFSQTSQNLATIQQGLDQSVVQTVDQVNQLTAQVADLNQQIQTVSNAGQNPGSLEDQRDQVLKTLSGLIDTAVVYSDDGTATVTTTNGTLLACGNQSDALTTQLDTATGMHQVLAQGTDITSTIAGGQLQGFINARDEGIPSAQTSLDNLAAGLISAVNQQQSTGYDMTGAKGADFFTPFTPSVAGSNAGAAATMAVAITDTDQIAASSDGTQGDNGNATALAGLQDKAIVSGQTAGSFYSNLIDQVGNTVSNSTSEQEAIGLVLQQLTNQQSAVSGVSLDEEATNLISYQRAYEAAARVISTVDELVSTTINMFTPSS